MQCSVASRWIAGLVLVLSSPFAALAHHSRAAFDTSVEVILEGTVADVLWANPHVYFTIEMTGADGARVLQEVEVGPLSTLQPLGLTRNALVQGERVTVRANPNRRGAGHVVVGLEVTKSDGEVFPLHVVSRGRPAPAAARAASLEGRWVPANDGFMGLVQGSRNWPVTEVGRAGLADGVGDSQVLCTPWPAPMIMALPMLRTIDVDDDSVEIDFDWMNAKRLVRLDLAEHPSRLQPTLQGHSIGRWDGETLVIDTLAFAPHEEGAGYGVPGGLDKRLIERLTLADDRSRLRYEFTVTDPLSLREPVTYAMEWIHRPDLTPTGQACDRELAERALNER